MAQIKQIWVKDLTDAEGEQIIRYLYDLMCHHFEVLLWLPGKSVKTSSTEITTSFVTDFSRGTFSPTD